MAFVSWRTGNHVISRLKYARSFSKVDGRRPRPFVRQDSEMLSAEFEGRNDPIALVAGLQEAQRQAIAERVPWFQDNMPPSYNRVVDPDTKLSHLSAIVGMQDLSDVPEVFLRGNNGDISVIGPGTSPGQLKEQLKKLPGTKPLSGLNLFVSLDGRVSVNIFNFSDVKERVKHTVAIGPELEEYVKDLQSGKFIGNPAHATPAR